MSVPQFSAATLTSPREVTAHQSCCLCGIGYPARIQVSLPFTNNMLGCIVEVGWNPFQAILAIPDLPAGRQLHQQCS